MRSLPAARYPAARGENEFGLMVRAHQTVEENRELGLRRLRSLIEKGVIRTTRVKVLRDGVGWGFYFHGFSSPRVWRSWG